jgi:transketolase
VLADPPNDATPGVILIGTGSELSLCVAAFESLTADGVAVRVVSLPCWELFERQDQVYRESVLPPSVTARVAVEAGVSAGWAKYVGLSGAVIALDTFGMSGPAGEVFEHLGFTADAVVAAARKLL